MFRQADLPGEALYHPNYLVSSNKPEGKGESKWCRVADESVVVVNSQPTKAGNRLEGKTERTVPLRHWAWWAKSLLVPRRDEGKPKRTTMDQARMGEDNRG
jgi:hypothetical protein